MPTVVGVNLRNHASPATVGADGVTADVDDVVVVRSDRGEELGRVVSAPVETQDAAPADAVVRVATREDLERAEELHRKEREAMRVYRRLVSQHGLEMKPTDVEFLFDGNRAVFYFVAEERVDFRELVRDLSAEFHVRVDMRQIGVRDEARMIGGLGHCGEQLCCVRFGGEFQPVSIRMAKEQDLPLNPLKISGLCGRLMCCLRYEYDAYKDFKGRAPKKGAIVDAGGSPAKVVELNTPRERVTMRREDGTRLTVGLEDMECCKGQGCPCSVKAEALERSMAAMGIDLSGPATGSTRELRESTAARDAAKTAGAPAAAPEAASAEEPAKRKRRRRRGTGSGTATAEPGKQAAPAGKQTKQPAAGKQPKQAKQPKPAGQRPVKDAAGEQPAASPARRRRRRRSGGTGPAGGAEPSA